MRASCLPLYAHLVEHHLTTGSRLNLPWKAFCEAVPVDKILSLVGPLLHASGAAGPCSAHPHAPLLNKQAGVPTLESLTVVPAGDARSDPSAREWRPAHTLAPAMQLVRLISCCRHDFLRRSGMLLRCVHLMHRLLLAAPPSAIVTVCSPRTAGPAAFTCARLHTRGVPPLYHRDMPSPVPACTHEGFRHYTIETCLHLCPLAHTRGSATTPSKIWVRMPRILGSLRTDVICFPCGNRHNASSCEPATRADRPAPAQTEEAASALLRPPAKPARLPPAAQHISPHTFFLALTESAETLADFMVYYWRPRELSPDTHYASFWPSTSIGTLRTALYRDQVPHVWGRSHMGALCTIAESEGGARCGLVAASSRTLVWTSIYSIRHACDR